MPIVHAIVSSRVSPRMPRRLARLALAAAALAGMAGVLSPRGALLAQAAELPQVENSKHSFFGQLKENTLVSSGPGTNFYHTQRLEKGAQVVVVGVQNEWLKIVPPADSFSYIHSVNVQLYGSADAPVKRGKVTGPANVRAGSKVQPSQQWAVQCKLDVRDEVEVLGEEAQSFKIKPPKNAYSYIPRDAVEALGPVRGPIAGGEGTGGVQPQQPVTPPTPREAAVSYDGSSTSPGGTAGTATPPVAPATRGSDATASTYGGTPSPTAAAPSTRPNEAATLLTLQKLETEFAAASKLPLAEQPVEALLARYQEISATPGLAEPTKRVADVRVATLKLRLEAREQFAAVQAQQQQIDEQIRARAGEREELEQRLREVDVKIYAAVGTLRPSSLQIARTPLYRLTDPATGRTVAYVWATDSKVTDAIGQFVGVKGPLQTDSRLNLKVITPTAVEQVDQAKVNTTVAAEIVPPSLLPKGGTASVAETTSQP